LGELRDESSRRGEHRERVAEGRYRYRDREHGAGEKEWRRCTRERVSIADLYEKETTTVGGEEEGAHPIERDAPHLPLLARRRANL